MSISITLQLLKIPLIELTQSTKIATLLLSIYGNGQLENIVQPTTTPRALQYLYSESPDLRNTNIKQLILTALITLHVTMTFITWAIVFFPPTC